MWINICIIYTVKSFALPSHTIFQNYHFHSFIVYFYKYFGKNSASIVLIQSPNIRTSKTDCFTSQSDIKYINYHILLDS